MNTYQSCKETPLSTFIYCIVEGDYTALIKQGSSTFERAITNHIDVLLQPDTRAKLEAAWLSIYSEYCDLIGGIQITALIGRAKTINALSSKIDRISLLLQTARQVVSDELMAALKAEGYATEVARMASADDAGYLAQLDTIEAKLKPERVKLSALIKELKKPEEKKQKAKEEDFTLTLMEVSKYEGYPVREDVTVYQYCLHVRRLRTHIESLMKSQQKAKAHG